MTVPFWRPPEPSEERDRLLDAVLAHVPFDGWTDKALIAAAADLDIEADEARRTFPGGALDMIGYHSARADRRMSEAATKLDLSALGTRQRIAAVLRARFEANAEAREAIRAATNVLGLPPNMPIALALLYRTVDTAWWASGDVSTDFSFYTKRALLAGVYVATLTFWLGDRSEGCSETWAFLDRRLDDVMRIQKARGRLETGLPDLPGLMRAFRQATSGRRPRHRREWPEPEHPAAEPPERTSETTNGAA